MTRLRLFWCCNPLQANQDGPKKVSQCGHDKSEAFLVLQFPSNGLTWTKKGQLVQALQAANSTQHSAAQQALAGATALANHDEASHASGVKTLESESLEEMLCSASYADKVVGTTEQTHHCDGFGCSVACGWCVHSLQSRVPTSQRDGNKKGTVRGEAYIETKRLSRSANIFGHTVLQVTPLTFDCRYPGSLQKQWAREPGHHPFTLSKHQLLRFIDW
eukprot:1158343-Pelagomonas_calceolata.AAC.1